MSLLTLLALQNAFQAFCTDPCYAEEILFEARRIKAWQAEHPDNTKPVPNAPKVRVDIDAGNGEESVCKNGHPRTEENTDRGKSGKLKNCRQCLRDRANRKYAQKKANVVPCSVAECEQFSTARGMCSKHYQRELAKKKSLVEA